MEHIDNSAGFTRSPLFGLDALDFGVYIPHFSETFDCRSLGHDSFASSCLRQFGDTGRPIILNERG